MTTTTELQLLCRNIQNLRRHYQLSQKEMAQRMHIGIRSLRMLERGNIPPRLGINFLFYIHKHFGFKPAEIVSIDVLQHFSGLK